MGIGDLFRKKKEIEKTQVQKGEDPWTKEEVETYKKRMLELIPEMHSNFNEIKKIYDRAKEEAWKRTDWKKKNVREVPGKMYISVSPIGGWDNPKEGELERVRKANSANAKQNEIDEAFIYRCKNKEMMLFTKYISETEFEFLKNTPYKNYINYFVNQKEFFKTLNYVAGKDFATNMKIKYNKLDKW
jgi:hypothetical protein